MEEKLENSGEKAGAEGDCCCLEDCPHPALPLRTGGGGEGSAAPVISYATPAHLSQEAGYWRQGGFVVISREMKGTPRYCFKCGKAASVVHHVEVQLFLSLRHSQATVRIPLCERHNKKQRQWKWASVYLIVLGFLLIIGACRAVQLRGDTRLGILMMGIFSIPFAIYVGKIGLKFVIVKRIDSKFVTVAGAGNEFLVKLPDYSEK